MLEPMKLSEAINMATYEVDISDVYKIVNRRRIHSTDDCPEQDRKHLADMIERLSRQYKSPHTTTEYKAAATAIIKKAERKIFDELVDELGYDFFENIVYWYAEIMRSFCREGKV